MRAFSASFSSRAFCAMALTASNSSRCTTSRSRSTRSAWARTTFSISLRTPSAAPAAPVISLPSSSKNRPVVCVMNRSSLALSSEAPRLGVKTMRFRPRLCKLRQAALRRLDSQAVAGQGSAGSRKLQAESAWTSSSSPTRSSIRSRSRFGPVSVRWYGLAYMAGILLGWLYGRYLVSRPISVGRQVADDRRAGRRLSALDHARHRGRRQARLRAVLRAELFLAEPVRDSGGVERWHVVPWRAARRRARRLCILAHQAASIRCRSATSPRRRRRSACSSAGIANFINAEVVGRVTDVPWAMVFPGAGDLPRHPSQLYEASLEGIVLFIILRIATHQYHALTRPGTVFGLFLDLLWNLPQRGRGVRARAACRTSDGYRHLHAAASSIPFP